jgi:hypothetical protein
VSLIFNQPLVRLRAEATTDRYGNTVPGSWDDPERFAIGLWAIDAGDTSERIENRDSSVVDYTARRRGDISLALKTSDRVEWRGEAYTIVGDIRYQPGPSRLTSHSILRLRRAEG